METHEVEEAMHHPCKNQKVAIWTKWIVRPPVTYGVAQVVEIVLRGMWRSIDCTGLGERKLTTSRDCSVRHIGKMGLSNCMEPLKEYLRCLSFQSVFAEADDMDVV